MNCKFSFSLVFASLIALASCKKSDDQTVPPDTALPVGSTVDVRGTISSSTTWKKEYVYRLRGYVYVTGGATLTIEPGTRIVSNRDSAAVLVIYRDATIMADATASNPIVFTSAEANPQPGDLGGLVIAGQATTNGNHAVIEGGLDPAFSAFGGNNDAHNSGVLRYVRIEYAGKAVNPGDEVNGLSLYAVGSGTTIDYVQVVRGLDDAFEFFGGTVNCKHLIAYNCADDDYDMDDGYRGKIQFGISMKDPGFTDNKGTSGDVSNNFEVDNVNPANGFLLTRTPITFPVLSNFTAIGPNGAASTTADFGWGMRWRRGTKFILANSVVIGGKRGGMRLQEDSTIAYYLRGTNAFYNSILHGLTTSVDLQTGLNLSGGLPYDLSAVTGLTAGAYKSAILTAAADAKLSDPFNSASPNLKPATGSVLLNGALFDYGTLNDAFFDKVSFRGALDAGNDWTAGWTVWNK